MRRFEGMVGARRRVLVWDLPTRMFHWLLAASVAGAVATAQIGGNLMVWHGRLGILVVGLVAFRLVWGLLGSTYARFAQFLPSRQSLSAYLKGRWQGLGHNPLGALSVLALLGAVGVQAATGLFANDDIAFTGPLYPLIDSALSEGLTGIHHLLATLIYVLVALHLAAIVFYARAHKDNLVKPMITGWKEAEEGESARGGSLPALLLALALAGLAAWGAAGTWVPEPPPPPAAASPAW